MDSYIALASNPAVLGVLAMVAEVIMRMMPTEKPLSIAQVVAKVIRSIAKVAEVTANALDKILPQNIKPPVA